MRGADQEARPAPRFSVYTGSATNQQTRRIPMESNVIFEGPGPFHLPVAQHARADGHTNNGVTLTLQCLLPRRGGEMEAVNVQMLASVAREAAVRLLQAAEQSETGGQRS